MHLRYVFFLIMLMSLSPIFFCEQESGERISLFKPKSKIKEREKKKDEIGKRNRLDDVKFFDDISENPTENYPPVTKPDLSLKHRHSKDESLTEIKALLARLLEKIDEIESDSKNESTQTARGGGYTEEYLGNIRPGYIMPTRYPEQTTIPSSSPKLSLIQRIERRRRKKERKEEKRQRWGKWTNWSPCSVSCGKGREIRWRHCLENCDVAETEMEEKTCQLPACAPSKLDDAKKKNAARWSKWTNWSACSVTCGTGRQIRWRHCMENCDGVETEMGERSCEMSACKPPKLFGVIKLRA